MVGVMWLYCAVSSKSNTAPLEALHVSLLAHLPELAPRALEIAPAVREIPTFHTVDETQDGVIHSGDVHVGDIHLVLDPAFDVLKAHLPLSANPIGYKVGLVLVDLLEGEHVARPKGRHPPSPGGLESVVGLHARGEALLRQLLSRGVRLVIHDSLLSLLSTRDSPSLPSPFNPVEHAPQSVRSLRLPLSRLAVHAERGLHGYGPHLALAREEPLDLAARVVHHAVVEAQLHDLLQRGRREQLAAPVVSHDRLQHVVAPHRLARLGVLRVQRLDGRLVVAAVHDGRHVGIRGGDGDAVGEGPLVLLVVEKLRVRRGGRGDGSEVLDAAVHGGAEGEVDGGLGRDAEQLGVSGRGWGHVLEIEGVGALEVLVHAAHAHQVPALLLQHRQVVW